MLRRLVPITAFVLALASCTGKEDTTADEAAKAEAKSGVETIEIPSREPAKIEVIDAGAEPRVPLRLAPTPGAEETMALSLGMRMTMDNGVQPPTSVPVPMTKTTMKSTIQAVDAEGIRVRMKVTDVEVIAQPGTPPAVVEKVKETTEPLKQYTAAMTMSPRGHVLGGTVEIPRDLPAMVHNSMTQMTQSLGQIAVPLPEPALGIGATWTASYDLEQNGMKMRQVASYTLLDNTDSKIRLQVSIAQELLDPNVSVPGMLGAEARVSNFESAGKGTTVLDLRRATPETMAMTMEMAMTMDVTVLGQNQHMNMEMGIDMTMESP